MNLDDLIEGINTYGEAKYYFDNLISKGIQDEKTIDRLLEKEKVLKKFPSLYKRLKEGFDLLKKGGEESGNKLDKKREVGKIKNEVREEKKETVIIKKEVEEDYSPSLADLDYFYDFFGIVGEKKVRNLLVYGALAKAHLAIESLSGSGKTLLLEALLNLLPKEKVYFVQQASDKAFFNDPEINNYTFLVISEFQKISNHFFKEMVKTLAENKPATYFRTNNKKDGIDKIVISPGKSIIYTLAVSNEYFKEKDEEFKRRFIVFHTDISKKQNEEVIKNYACQSEKRIDDRRIESLKRHLKNCLELPYSFINPFLPYLTETIPEEIKANIKVRSFVKHFNTLVEGCSLFNYRKRLHNGKLFASFSDNQEVYGNYSKFFYNGIMSFSVIDEVILDTLEKNKPYTFDELVFLIEKNSSFNRLKIINESLDNLVDLKFIKKEDNQIIKIKDYFYPQELSSSAFDSARLFMEKNFPYSLEWFMEQNERQ